MRATLDVNGITRLLHEWKAGHDEALNELIPLVHHELRRLARARLSREQSGRTLQPTDLINEAYLRLVDIKEVDWQDRGHFFAVAATVMRRILVDASRHRGAKKRGDGARAVPLEEAAPRIDGAAQDLLALDEALRTLETMDARKAKIVELRFFIGLSVDETALALGVSPETIKRDWRLAKEWLREALSSART